MNLIYKKSLIRWINSFSTLKLNERRYPWQKKWKWDDYELSKMVDGGVPFPMLSDTGGKVGRVYGVFDEEAGVENRGRFIIDPDGVVQGFEVLTPPVGRNVGETIRQVQAFQLVRESKGKEATPSGWKPGKPTLKPGPDLVGKVWEVWKTKMAFD